MDGRVWLNELKGVPIPQSDLWAEDTNSWAWLRLLTLFAAQREPRYCRMPAARLKRAPQSATVEADG